MSTAARSTVAAASARCEHGRQRRRCMDCGGCEHGRLLSSCKDCGHGGVTILESTEVEESDWDGAGAGATRGQEQAHRPNSRADVPLSLVVSCGGGASTLNAETSEAPTRATWECSVCTLCNPKGARVCDACVTLACACGMRRPTRAEALLTSQAIGVGQSQSTWTGREVESGSISLIVCSRKCPLFSSSLPQSLWGDCLLLCAGARER